MQARAACLGGGLSGSARERLAVAGKNQVGVNGAERPQAGDSWLILPPLSR